MKIGLIGFCERDNILDSYPPVGRKFSVNVMLEHCEVHKSVSKRKLPVLAAPVPKIALRRNLPYRLLHFVATRKVMRTEEYCIL